MSAKNNNTNKYGSKKKSQTQGMTTAQSLSDYFVKGVMLVYVFFMVVLYPLLYHDKYFDMGAAKYQIFKWSAIVGLGVMTVIWIIWMLSFKDKLKPEEELKHLSLTDYFAIGFLFISILSYLLSSDRTMALWGYEGWFMGVMSQLFFILAYFYVSRFWDYSKATIVCMVGAATICYQIGILQRFGFNPLGLYDGVGVADIEKFLSTLGQTSWYSSYAILIVPFGMYFYWTTENIKVRVATGIFTALGFGMLCTTNSDSAYVAMVLILMVFFRYSLESNDKMKRFLEISIIGVFAMRVIGWMYALFPERQRTYTTGDEKISKFVTSSTAMLILLIALLAAYALFWVITNKPKDKEKTAFDISKYKTIIWRITVVAAVLVIVGVAACVVLVTTGKMPEALSALNGVSFFNFDMAWGNHRGFNWRAAWEAFTRANGKDLLIGVGPDCFASAMDKYYAQEVADYWHGLQLACAHNEWLNMLVTEGILGLAAYVGIFVTSIARASKYVKDEPVLVALMAATLAYMGHDVFCYQQCICTPEVFIFMAITEMIIRSKKRGAE